jgi:hypothetical protein
MFLSLKIPPDWKDDGEEELNYKNLVRRVILDKPNWGLGFDGSISLYNNPNGLGRRDFWWREIVGSEGSFTEHGAQYVKDVTEWNIDGKEALSLYFTEYSGGGTYFMIPRGNQMIEIFFRVELSQNDELESIISTIDFLD